MCLRIIPIGKKANDFFRIRKMPSGVNEETKAEGKSVFSAARISPDIILPNNIKKGNPVISVMLCDVDNKAKLGFISFSLACGFLPRIR